MVMLMTALPVAAEDFEKAWVGQPFQPEQCVAIQKGETTFRRKLCRIDYRIVPSAGGYAVEGVLSFNSKFVPRRPRRIDLEILLIDRSFVCIEQINMHREVGPGAVDFSFAVPGGSQARYLRTYYILQYE
jgi:hypothetical protein